MRTLEANVLIDAPVGRLRPGAPLELLVQIPDGGSKRKAAKLLGSGATSLSRKLGDPAAPEEG